MTAEVSCLRTQQQLDGLLKDYNALVRKDGTIPPMATTTFMFNQTFVKGSEDDPKCKCGKFIREHPNAASSHTTSSNAKMNDELNSVVTYCVSFKIVNALEVKGARAFVYRTAQQYLGFYDADVVDRASVQHQTNIHYAELDLVCRVLFKLEPEAQKFVNALDEAKRSPLVNFRIENVNDSSSAGKKCGCRIMLDDYDPTGTVSPIQTLQELSSHSSMASEAASVISLDKPLCKNQMLERPLCRLQKPERCHLIDHAACVGKFKKFDNDENNMLALYHDGLHNLIDGLETPDLEPAVILVFVKNHKACPPTGCGGCRPCQTIAQATVRYRVDLRIECTSEDAYAMLKPMLKDGTEDVGNNSFLSYVYVADPVTFAECLNWKENKSRKRQRQE